MNALKSVSFIALGLILLFAGCNDNSTQPENNTQDELNKNAFLAEAVDVMQDLTNGDMENGTSGYWYGGLNSASYQFEYSESEFQSPTHSLSITASGGTSESFAYWAQTFDATNYTGKKVILNVASKYADVVGEGIMFVFRGDDTEFPEGTAESFNTTQGKVIFNGTSDWRTLEIDMDPVPNSIKSLTVYMLISAQSGTVYFDDLKFSLTDATPESKGLVNGDFETGTYAPTKWWVGSTANGQIELSWDNTEYLSANHSVKISSDTQTDQFSFWGQTFSAEEFAGNNIKLDVNIKAANLSGKGVYLAIRGDDTEQPSGSAEMFSTTQYKSTILGDFDWTQYSVSSDTIPKNIKSITVYLIYGDTTTGAVYFDDVSVNKN